MTATQLSIESAPRDLEKLKEAGRFNLRALATQLEYFKDEAAKQAFMSMSNDQQAETILKLLEQRDGGGKGKTAAGASGRQPSTKNASSKGAATTTTAIKAGSGETQGASVANVGAGAEKILAAINALNSNYDGLKESIDTLTQAVGRLEGISAGTNRFVALSIGLSMKLAEQVLQSDPGTILDVVLEDMPIVEEAMKKMAPADEDEGEGVEGNDE